MEFARPHSLRTHRNISYGRGSGTRPLTVSLIGRWFGHRVEPKHRSCTLTREVLGRLRPQYKEKGPLLKQMRPSKKTSSRRVSRGPRESRWKLWCSLAEQRNLPPLPVTVDLIDKVGALLKQARYRSAAQYYSVAKSEHRAHGHDWPASLDHAVAQAVRSITRGMGPSSAKLDFPLEVCSRSFDGDVVRAYSTLQVPEHARIEAPADTGIVASWFLLRGLEISSVVCEDIAFARDGLVKLHLPVSKVDPTARGCHRSHACICERQHDPGCSRSGDEALVVHTYAEV